MRAVKYEIIRISTTSCIQSNVKYETLMKAGQEGTLHGKKIPADKVMTPSIQNSIVVDWLVGIDEYLDEEVEQYYARDL